MSIEQGVTLDGAELEDLEVEGPKERLQVPEMGGEMMMIQNEVFLTCLYLCFYIRVYMNVYYT